MIPTFLKLQINFYSVILLIAFVDWNLRFLVGSTGDIIFI